MTDRCRISFDILYSEVIVLKEENEWKTLNDMIVMKNMHMLEL